MSVLAQLAYTSSYEYSTYSPAESAAMAGMSIGVIIFSVILWIGLYVFLAVCLMKIFAKAGRQDTWAAWVPIYNMWVLFEIAGRPGWWALSFLLGFIPVVGAIVALIVTIIAMIDLAKSFGKDTGYAVLLILLPIVGYPMLAFGDAQYRGPAGPEGAKAGVAPAAPQYQQPVAPQAPAANDSSSTPPQQQ